MYEYKAKVARWIDGDTVIVDIDLGFYVTVQQKIRLLRINAPELHGDIPYQVRRAKHARAVAKKACPTSGGFCPEGEWVTIVTQKENKDVYSRYLAEVVYKGTNLS
jgi:micrococcal nuclease